MKSTIVRSANPRRKYNMSIETNDAAHRALFSGLSGGFKVCNFCGHTIKPDEKAFADGRGDVLIHTRCVLRMASVVEAGAGNEAEAELIEERKRIQETGKFYE